MSAAVLLAYGLWLASVLPATHGALDFAFIYRPFLRHAPAYSPLAVDPAYLRTRDAIGGYDGQFAYYIAVDPLNARLVLDEPTYRYTRILYPLAARLLALGQTALVPYALVAINWLAIAMGTLAVACWLRRKRLSPWLAAVYGFYPGLAVALWCDVTEAFAYGLVAVGVYFYDRGAERRVLWAGLFFGLAALTRETTALFPLVCGLALLPPHWRAGTRAGVHGSSSWRQGVLLLALALGPLALYSVFLRLWLGPSSSPARVTLLAVPFAGLLSQQHWTVVDVLDVAGVIVPALICAGMALWALCRRRVSVYVWILLAGILVTVVDVTAPSYDYFLALARVSTGVPLAALYCLPAFDHLTERRRTWLILSAVLWLSLLPYWWLFVDHIFLRRAGGI